MRFVQAIGKPITTPDFDKLIARFAWVTLSNTISGTYFRNVGHKLNNPMRYNSEVYAEDHLC